MAAACDAVDEALDKLAALGGGVSSSAEGRELVARMETWCRRVPALQHQLINDLAEHASAEELGGRLSLAIANDLRITKSEAKRRIAEADDLGARQSLVGEPLAPRLEATAAGQAAGLIGREHVRIIRSFFARLPSCIDEPTRAVAERKLADVASQYRPDQLQRYADHYELVLNPDGNYSEEDRARRRALSLGPQGPDGMSRLSGYLTPEARAGWEAIAAKWAGPGMCNPNDDVPTIAGTPSQQAIDADARSAAQRRHDALNAMVRSVLMSGELGSHQGLPVTITATVALADLQAKTGTATTGTDTLLPVTDLIRMAAQAYNYLLVFDNATPVELYKGRTTRCATPAQRLVLTATEHGCTFPGCDVPATWCQVHHVTDWANGGPTDIVNETLACGPHNRLVDEDGWRTRKRKDGVTQWIPPPHLDTGQPRTNSYWHPEKMLPEEEDDGP